MKYTIKDMPSPERPRERLKELGSSYLSDKEILAIILKTGTKEKNVNELSLEFLKTYSLEELKNISLQQLTTIKGIGEVKAIELLAAVELGKRIYLRDYKKFKKLENPKDIWEYSKYLFNGLKQEYFYGFYFNNKQELIHKKLIYMGTINSATTHTREIFKEAYQVSAATIVCLHNHPSNDPTPSKADIYFTKTLMNTGQIQGIPVIDHIIVAENTYYSFYEQSDFKNL